MKILMLHNYYQKRGGEDECAEQEVQLLRDHGHDVLFRTRHNDEIHEYSALRKAALFLEPTWSRRSRDSVEEDIRQYRPDVVHVHNFFPLISPSVHVGCSKAGIPVVQTLHNYRLLAPCALLSREGAVCERCIRGSLLNGVVLRCYRKSAVQTASVALMIKAHRILRTWERHVSVFISLTEFVRGKFEEAGFDVSRMVVRPNFLAHDPGVGDSERSGAVYLGRLSEEKGVRTLLEAWRLLSSDVSLSLIGDGPLAPWAAGYVQRHKVGSVRLHGWLKPEAAFDLVKRSQFLILPSVCYEGFPRTVVEAYATGTPALVSGHGAVGSVVQPGRTGLTFEPGNPADLAEKARYMLDHPQETREWGEHARSEFLQRYTAEPAYRSLMGIYRRAIEARQRGGKR
jgi:glycosyltransferase involved in cell wall biosynthesis